MYSNYQKNSKCKSNFTMFILNLNYLAILLSPAPPLWRRRSRATCSPCPWRWSARPGPRPCTWPSPAPRPRSRASTTSCAACATGATSKRGRGEIGGSNDGVKLPSKNTVDSANTWRMKGEKEREKIQANQQTEWAERERERAKQLFAHVRIILYRYIPKFKWYQAT